MQRDRSAGKGHDLTADGAAAVARLRPDWVNRRRLGLALVVISTAQVMVVLDATIVNIALPFISADLDVPPSQLPWVVTSYTLVFGGALLLGGRLGDLYGRRRVFTAGLVLFSMASLMGGLAQGPTMLLIARAAQGLGAALASPTALALITTTFPRGPARHKAFGVYAIMSGGGSALGMILGGWLTGLDPHILGVAVSGWRLTLLINVPLGLLAAAGARVVLGESQRHAGQLDLPGAITATGGLILIAYGLTSSASPDRGWGDPAVLASIGAGVALLLAFVVIESRVAHPLLPFAVFGGSRTASCAVLMMLSASMLPLFYFLSLVCQVAMGFTPLETGLGFVPFTVAMILMAPMASRAVSRARPGRIAAAGAAAIAAGLWGISRIPVDGSRGHMGIDAEYLPDVLPYMVLMGIGISYTTVPMTLTALHGVDDRHSGVASGVLNTMQQVGGSLGLAALSTLALHVGMRTHARLDSDVGQPDNSVAQLIDKVALVQGASAVFLVGAVLMGAGAAIAFLLVRVSKTELAADEVVQTIPAVP